MTRAIWLRAIRPPLNCLPHYPDKSSRLFKGFKPYTLIGFRVVKNDRIVLRDMMWIKPVGVCVALIH